MPNPELRVAQNCAFCCCAMAIAVSNASSAGDVFAGSRLSRISPRKRCRNASLQCFSCLLRQRQRVVNPRQGVFHVLPFGFDLGEHSVKEGDPILDPDAVVTAMLS